MNVLFALLNNFSLRWLWHTDSRGAHGRRLRSRGAGHCLLTKLMYVFFPVMETRLFFFFYIWWLSLNFKYLVIRSIGRSVCALRLQIKSLFCEHFCCTKSNALTVQWKCFPQTCEINLFIGRNQNKPLWSGNIIVPFGVYFDEAYNTIPVNHLFKS